MSNTNTIVITGRLVKTEPLKTVTENTVVIENTLAVNKNYSAAKQKTCLFKFKVWNKTARNLQTYLTQGSKITITGELDQDNWEYENKTYSQSFINAIKIDLLEVKSKQEIFSEPSITLA